MRGLYEHFALTLRLHLRNKLALLYGYLFPLIFLVAFWVLYRHEKIPLLRHMGELLTVSVLGGACFGLPTTLVSDRERGVWRRYRLAPVPTWMLVTSTAIARYAIVLSAGLLQLGVALALGMTRPEHPLDLWVAFSFVSFAFIGLGLVIAMLADNVPAVQALGQCIFLPMLIIGGVAVPLRSLPDWAQHVSAFFPGRYAVESLQAAVTGPGLPGTRFSLAALGLIGAAACFAGAKLFRWDAQQRFFNRGGKLWLAPVFAMWIAVGALAEWRGRIAAPSDAAAAPRPLSPNAPPAQKPPPAPEPPWAKMTESDIARLDFRLPPDDGIVAPIADSADVPDGYISDQVEKVRQQLLAWPPADEMDDVQRVRNLLCVAGVPDAIQQPVERYLPLVVLQHLLDEYAKEKLVKILTWIALHPEEGMVIDSIADLGVEGQAGDPAMVRDRVQLYALKFIARLTGRKIE